LLNVASLQIGNIDAAAAARLGIQLLGLVANERNNIVDLRDGKSGEWRHAFLDTPVVDHRSNFVSLTVRVPVREKVGYAPGEGSRVSAPV
jgi:hypothetical protein